MVNAVRRTATRSSRGYGALALAPALLLLGGSPTATAAPPSPIVVEHLIAQTGLSVGFGVNQVALFFTLLSGDSSSTCTASYGNNAFTLGRSTSATAVVGIYFDNACAKPYFTDNLRDAPSGSVATLVHTGQFDAPNGAILGALSLAQQLEMPGSTLIIAGKGTYKAVAGVGEPPVRTGLACSEILGGSTITFTCQEGVAQDFPALKLALGNIVHFTMTVTEVSGLLATATVTGSSAKLATGKLGGLSIAVTSPTTLGFQGQATIVGSGATSGASPAFSVIPTPTTHWTFNDSQHTTIFSISTAGNLASTGKVKNSSTNATATFTVDASGTGTIAYSDKSKAKITNWTLSD